MSRIFFFILVFILNIGSNLANDINDSLKADYNKIDSTNNQLDEPFFGFVFKVNAKDFSKGAILSPMQLIQGKVPGFTIFGVNGNDPNPNLQIQLRGTSTLYLSTEPLYIIDGIPMASPDIIAADNIESIEILKSLSETAPYGIRGSNGVVIIKTKQDNSTKLAVTYETYAYIETLYKKSEFMMSSEWRQFKQELKSSSYPKLVDHSERMIDYNSNTDWLKEISQNKLSLAHNLGIYGEFNKTSYSINMNYNNYNGVIQKTGNIRYNGQLLLSQLALKDKLKIDLSFTGSSKKYSSINSNPYFNSSNIISETNRYNPTIPVYNNDGLFGSDTTGYYNSPNPLSLVKSITDQRRKNDYLTHIQISYEILSGLKVSSSYSKYKVVSENSFSKNKQEQSWIRDGEEIWHTRGNRVTNIKEESIYSLKLNYNKSVAFHEFDLSFNFATQKGFINFNSHDSIVEHPNLSVSGSKVKFNLDFIYISFLSTAKYNYKNKYFLSFRILRETTLLYSWEVTTHYFPSLSVTWSPKNEKLLQNITWLNKFDIRMAYGLSKRPYYSDFQKHNLSYSVMGNQNLHGEKLSEGNFGIDLGLLSNRLRFSVDYYNRNTKDGLFKSELPTVPDYTIVITNYFKIQNKGWEFYLHGKPFIKPFIWTFDFNISFNENIMHSEYYESGINIKGQAFGNITGYQFAGYTNTNKILIYNQTGDTTSTIINENKKILGNYIPKSFFGFTNNLKYKNFDLSIFMRGALGFELKNTFKYLTHSSENQMKALQTLDQRDLVNSYLRRTDYFIEKADYIKIDNISLGYTTHLRKKYINSLKLYIACNNVAIFTNYKGGDPDRVSYTSLSIPYDNVYNEYPRTRIFLIGLKFSL